ncbi:hypothetical protein GCM10022221_18190 [Actinocorallia aurea]
MATPRMPWLHTIGAHLVSALIGAVFALVGGYVILSTSGAFDPPQGPQGVTGPQGPQGPQGPMGLTGPQGRAGAPGRDARPEMTGPMGCPIGMTVRSTYIPIMSITGEYTGRVQSYTFCAR